jgi:hypothetical protein
MKRLAFFFTLLIVICGLDGCGNASREQRSAFFSSFSIGSIVEENEQYLVAGSRISSGAEAGPAAPPFQKHEEMIVQVDTTNVFAFMEAVRSDIEQALTSSGATIHGRGNGGQEGGLADIEYFSFRYSEDEADGVINVWGVRGEGTSFNLIVLITES